MRGVLSGRRAFVAGLVLLAVLPFLSRALRGPRPPSCAADGVALAGAPLVEMEEAHGPVLRFCSIGCAERWILATGAVPAGIRVTDEAGGGLVPAADAWYVRSLIPSQPATGDRVHAFASREDALRHAETYRGTVLAGDERPFRGIPDRAEGIR